MQNTYPVRMKTPTRLIASKKGTPILLVNVTQKMFGAILRTYVQEKIGKS
jgi:hypothetical protein